MKPMSLNKILLLGTMLLLPINAIAQNDPPGNAAGMNCPMMAQTAEMQKDLTGMMGDMDAMMKSIRDLAARERMQKMHEQMSAMMVNMQKMSGGMMGGMMPQGTNGTGGASPATPPAPTEDHEAHHPNP